VAGSAAALRARGRPAGCCWNDFAALAMLRARPRMPAPSKGCIRLRSLNKPDTPGLRCSATRQRQPRDHLRLSDQITVFAVGDNRRHGARVQRQTRPRRKLRPAEFWATR
jgi:hypothetical protein